MSLLTDSTFLQSTESIQRLLDSANRGRKSFDTILVLQALQHLGGLSDDPEGVTLLTTEDFLNNIIDILKWSILDTSLINMRDDLSSRRARTRDMDQSKNYYYLSKTTTVALQLLLNIITTYCNKKRKTNAGNIKRILLAESIDQCITNLSFLLIQNIQIGKLAPTTKVKKHFDLAIAILSRTCELESVRSQCWMKEKVADHEEKKSENGSQHGSQHGSHTSESRPGSRGSRRNESSRPTTPNAMHPTNTNTNNSNANIFDACDIDQNNEIEMDGIDLLADILDNNYSLNNNNHIFRIVNLLTKWNETAKEKAIACIQPTVDILLHYLNEDNDVNDHQILTIKKEILLEQAFGMLASMSYNCVPVMESMLNSNIGPLCIQSFVLIHETNSNAVIQILGFLCSFLVSGGPKVAISMIPYLLTTELISSVLTSIQMFARIHQLQRLGINILSMIVSLVLCNIKEKDVDSEVSDEDDDSDYEMEGDGTTGTGSKPIKPLTKRDILFQLFNDLNVLDVIKSVQDRIKLMNAYYSRRNDEKMLLYVKKTEQSIALMYTWHTRQQYILDHPDSDED